VRLEAANGSTGVFFVKKNHSFAIGAVEFALWEEEGGRLRVVVSFNESTPFLPSENQSSGGSVEVVSTTATKPQPGGFCVEQGGFGITVEKSVKAYSNAGRVFSLVEFKLQNTGANETPQFVLKDFSTGREFLVESIPAFGQKTISFVVEGTASASEKPMLQPTRGEGGLSPSSFYWPLLLFILVEAVVVWRLIFSSSES